MFQDFKIRVLCSGKNESFTPFIYCDVKLQDFYEALEHLNAKLFLAMPTFHYIDLYTSHIY